MAALVLTAITAYAIASRFALRLRRGPHGRVLFFAARLDERGDDVSGRLRLSEQRRSERL